MKKFFLLFAAAFTLLAACNNNDSTDNPQLNPSPFAGTFNGTYTLTTSAQPQGKPATVVVTDNPNGSLHFALSVDGQTADLTATLNGEKIVFDQQPIFGANFSGYGEMPASDHLHLSFTSVPNGTTVTELSVYEFQGNR